MMTTMINYGGRDDDDDDEVGDTIVIVIVTVIMIIIIVITTIIVNTAIISNINIKLPRNHNALVATVAVVVVVTIFNVIASMHATPRHPPSLPVESAGPGSFLPFGYNLSEG